jgi:hypothetical protein
MLMLLEREPYYALLLRHGRRLRLHRKGREKREEGE